MRSISAAARARGSRRCRQRDRRRRRPEAYAAEYGRRRMGMTGVLHAENDLTQRRTRAALPQAPPAIDLQQASHGACRHRCRRWRDAPQRRAPFVPAGAVPYCAHTGRGGGRRRNPTPDDSSARSAAAGKNPGNPPRSAGFVALPRCRVPPYHGGSEAVTAYTRGHSRACLSCKSARQRVSPVPARAPTCSRSCTRLVPAALACSQTHYSRIPPESPRSSRARPIEAGATGLNPRPPA